MPIINKDNYLITFTPDKFGGRFTDPSYHISAFYEVWSRWAYDGRTDFWQKAATAAREYLHKVIDDKTGLNPDLRWVLIIIFFEILIPPEPFMRDAPHFFYRKYNKNLL